MMATGNPVPSHSPRAKGECHFTGETYQAPARLEHTISPVKWSTFARERNQVHLGALISPVKYRMRATHRTLRTNKKSAPLGALLFCEPKNLERTR